MYQSNPPISRMAWNMLLNCVGHDLALLTFWFIPGKWMRFPTIVVRGDVLKSWLTLSDYSRSQLAKELGVSRGRVSQLLTSHREPSAHLIAKLMLLTHLPFERLFTLLRGTPSSSSSADSDRSINTAHELALK